jgi:hypothetical protein
MRRARKARRPESPERALEVQVLHQNRTLLEQLMIFVPDHRDVALLRPVNVDI